MTHAKTNTSDSAANVPNTEEIKLEGSAVAAARAVGGGGVSGGGGSVAARTGTVLYSLFCFITLFLYQSQGCARDGQRIATVS